MKNPDTTAFEQAAAAAWGARHAVAVQHPALALPIAYGVLGLREGDRLWASPLANPAVVAAARGLGAVVDFVDVTPGGALSTMALAMRLEEAMRSGQVPRIVVVSHTAGQLCELAGINHLANLHGFYMVEDGSEAAGAAYGEHAVGSCRFSDVTIVALPDGCGAVATTNMDDWAAGLASACDADPFGATARLTPGLAAGAAEALTALAPAVAARRAQAEVYASRLAAQPVALPELDTDHRPAWPYVAIRVPPERRDAVAAAVGWAPVAPAWDLAPWPEAARWAASVVRLPLGPGVAPAAVAERVVAALK